MRPIAFLSFAAVALAAVPSHAEPWSEWKRFHATVPDESVVPANPRILVIVNTTGDDWLAHGNRDHDEAQITLDLLKRYPGAHYLLRVRGTTNAEIRAELERALGERYAAGAKVDALYIMSHGTGGLAGDDASDAGDYVSLITNESGSFRVRLDDPPSVASVFSPLSGMYDSGSRIIVDGCWTVAEGSPEVAKARMEKVADGFGLQEGSLYMNSTLRITSTRLYYLTPFYWHENVLLAAGGLFAQATAPISYPLQVGFEGYFFNQGYTLERGPGGSTVRADDLFSATEVPDPAVSDREFGSGGKESFAETRTATRGAGAVSGR